MIDKNLIHYRIRNNEISSGVMEEVINSIASRQALDYFRRGFTRLSKCEWYFAMMEAFSYEETSAIDYAMRINGHCNSKYDAFDKEMLATHNAKYLYNLMCTLTKLAMKRELVIRTSRNNSIHVNDIAR